MASSQPDHGESQLKTPLGSHTNVSTLELNANPKSTDTYPLDPSELSGPSIVSHCDSTRAKQPAQPSQKKKSLIKTKFKCSITLRKEKFAFRQEATLA